MGTKDALKLIESGYLGDCESGHPAILAHFDFILKYLKYQVAEPSPGYLYSGDRPS